MNIFFLDKNPKVAAKMQCDEHIKKMIIEYAQLLSTAHRILDGKCEIVTKISKTSTRKQKVWVLDDQVMNDKLYKATHYNHPSAIWCRQNNKNYEWLYECYKATCEEFHSRYRTGDKSKLPEHLSASLIPYLSHVPKNISVSTEISIPPQAVSDYLKRSVTSFDEVIQVYRQFYILEKSKFANWNHSSIPEWFNF